jgi:two-component system, OmpR family, sensor histidine kinase MprB
VTSPAAMPTRRSWLRERLHNLTLHSRVTLLAAVAVGLAVALVSIAAYLTVREQLYHNLDESLIDRASGAATGPLTDPEVVQQIPPEALGLSDTRVAVVNSAGEFLSGDKYPPPIGGEEVAVARRQADESVRTAPDPKSGALFRVVSVPAGPDTALVLAQSLGPVNRTLHNLGVVLWVFGLVGVIGAALVGNAVARNGLRPLGQLTAAAEHVARTEQLQPIPVTGTDEIARLAQSFNAMLAALAQSRDRQRRLVGDAGHELRTPLTSIRTNLELLAQADQRGGLKPEDRQQLLADVQAQMAELTTLIGDLTELARETPHQRGFEQIELKNVVEDAITRVRRRAPALRWDVQLTPFPVYGDEQLLGRAATNLLDNAAKYSPPDGWVSVRLIDGVLTVVDSGPGISDADLPHVFERFYRSTEARSRAGSGLGLAIVKHAAEQHGGMIYAGNAPNGGAQFTLWLPHANSVAPRS